MSDEMIMRRQIWLVVLILYAAGAIADTAYRMATPPEPGVHSSPGAALAVAFCAGLFWPIDIIARPLLMSR
jgi:hypothetical protein